MVRTERIANAAVSTERKEGVNHMPAVAEPLAASAGAGCCDVEQSGFAAYGTLLQVCSDKGPPEAFVSIAGLGDITGPTSSMGEAETTSHSGSGVRSYVPTLADPGEISFPCFWDPTDPTQAADSPYGLEYLFWNRIVTKWRLIAPDASHYTRVFCGFVKSLSEAYPTQGIATRQVTIRTTSPLQVVASPINVNPAQATIANTGGPLTFTVSTGGSPIMWTAVSGAPWITVDTPAEPTEGDGDVDLTIAAGTGAARSGSVTIPQLGLVYTVNQTAV